MKLPLSAEVQAKLDGVLAGLAARDAAQVALGASRERRRIRAAIRAERARLLGEIDRLTALDSVRGEQAATRVNGRRGLREILRREIYGLDLALRACRPGRAK